MAWKEHNENNKIITIVIRAERAIFREINFKQRLSAIITDLVIEFNQFETKLYRVSRQSISQSDISLCNRADSQILFFFFGKGLVGRRSKNINRTLVK